MPLSITLPSTKPTAEIPIGEGTDQILNYTWFDEHIEIPTTGFRNAYNGAPSYDVENTSYREFWAWFDKDSELITNKYFGGNSSWAYTDYNCTLHLYNIEKIEQSIQFVNGKIRIPNPLHRKLHDGSSITVECEDAFLVLHGYSGGNNYSEAVGFSILEGSLSNRNFHGITKLIFTQVGDNLWSSISTLGEDSSHASATYRYKMTSDSEYIWIEFARPLYYGDAVSIIPTNNIPSYSQTVKWITIMRKLPGDKYKSAQAPLPSYEINPYCNFKLSGKLLY